MKLGTINIGGKEYKTALTMRVLQRTQARSGKTLAEELQRIEDNFDIDAFMNIVHDMLEAGAAYCQKNGIPFVEPPALDDLYDIIALDEIGTIFGAVRNVSKDTPDIEVIPSKNT